MTEYVPDNYDIYDWYERDRIRFERLHKRNKQLGIEDVENDEEDE